MKRPTSTHKIYRAPKYRFFGRAEIRELNKTLETGETLEHCVFGYYQGGSGILAATNKRLLLIDKRPFFTHVDTFDYSTIHGIEFKRHTFTSRVNIRCREKQLSFATVSDAMLYRLHRHTVLIMKETIARNGSNGYKKVEPVFYRHPAWTPHTPHMIRKRPSKFGAFGSIALQ